VRTPSIISFFIPHQGCTYNCIFCNQKTITGQRSSLNVQDVVRTIEEYLPALPSPCEVAFYGGSFTALPSSLQESYLSCVEPYIQSGRITGIRVSTRPDAIDIPNLELLAHYGVKTIELGVQSLERDVLAFAGREYVPSQVAEASLLIKEKGFTLGHQLMIGLPLSDRSKELRSTRQVIQIGPSLIRIYPTLVIRGTGLARLFIRGEYQPLSLDEAIETTALMYIELEKARIKVIRMGLQTTQELEGPGEILAGPFHPAFGEMVYSRVFRWQAREAITRYLELWPAERLKLFVNRRSISKMVGQGRGNIIDLKREFQLCDLAVAGLESLEMDEVGVGHPGQDAPEVLLSRESFAGIFQ